MLISPALSRLTNLAEMVILYCNLFHISEAGKSMKKCSLIPFAVLAAAAGAGAAVGRKLKTDKAFRRDFDDAVGKVSSPSSARLPTNSPNRISAMSRTTGAAISIPVTANLHHRASAVQDGVSATPAAALSPTTTIKRTTT